jgi:hypothetical protein
LEEAEEEEAEGEGEEEEEAAEEAKEAAGRAHEFGAGALVEGHQLPPPTTTTTTQPTTTTTTQPTTTTTTQPTTDHDHEMRFVFVCVQCVRVCARARRARNTVGGRNSAKCGVCVQAATQPSSVWRVEDAEAAPRIPMAGLSSTQRCTPVLYL